MTEPQVLTQAEEAAVTQLFEAFAGDTDRLNAALSAFTESQSPGKQMPPSRKVEAQKPQNIQSAEPTTPVIVQLENVSRTYKMSKRNQVGAVHEVTLAIHEGEFIAITGASGSGKSTLLNLIGGLDRPDTGTITVGGHNLAKLSDAQLSDYRNQTVGFVFQFFYLQPFLSVATNLEVPGMFGRLTTTDRNARVAQLAEAVGLSDRLSHLPRELSGGQMQRAAIARALMNRPKLLLADEPTGNLDSTNSAGIMELFHKVRTDFGTTVIVITHDATIAAQADRIITMHDGGVAAC